jgi:hypothetical protein
MPSQLEYYDYSRVLSYNCPYNMIVGARGLGKTYGAKKKAIRDFIRKGEHHIYMRRYETEIFAKDNYFDDLIARNEFPDWDFRVNGRVGQIASADTRDDKKRKWETLVYFIPLSRSQAYKSIPFPKVTLIIFDEFIIEKSHMQYLPNEAKTFDNFYNTVDRYDDRVRVFFLANSVSIMNPYFLKYRIVPKDGDEMMILANGFVALHLPVAEAFAAGVRLSRFGQFITENDEEYADYAIGNGFSDNTGTLLSAKTPDAKYQYTLETKQATFSVWYDVNLNLYFVQRKLPKQERKFTIVPSRVDSDNLLLLPNDRIMQILRTSYRMARIRFDDPSTRNAFLDIFKR